MGMVTQATGTASWWPSRYGAGDQAGALNEIIPGKVLEAVRRVRRGLMHDLAHVLHQDIDLGIHSESPARVLGGQ
jgi:hypothetical protein